MGISKVQQQKWITAVQHNEFNIDIEKNNDKLHNIVYNNKKWNSKSIRRYGFNSVIYNMEMDKKSNNRLRGIDNKRTTSTTTEVQHMSAFKLIPATGPTKITTDNQRGESDNN